MIMNEWMIKFNQIHINIIEMESKGQQLYEDFLKNPIKTIQLLSKQP